jgi:hypothetical protein
MLPSAMKAFSRLALICCSLGAVLLTLAAEAQNSTGTFVTVVAVVASDPRASEAGSDAGAFTIARWGDVRSGLRVFFSLGGSAREGADYENIGTSVLIPAGAWAVRVPVIPIDDAEPESLESVDLTLMPSPMLNPLDSYRIGYPSNAVVTILDNDGNTDRTVVNLVATDPVASEIPEVPPGMGRPQLIDPAIFTVSRVGNISTPVTVHYKVEGTAANGVDYVEIADHITIPAGATSANIEINAIDDQFVEGPESVIITLQPAVCIMIYPPPPECYLVGASGRAEATIRDDDGADPNKPPLVSIALPADGSVFVAPADIYIAAYAFDSDGYVHTVEFFEGLNSLGVTTNNPFAASPINPFQIEWKAVGPGEYVLTALATDDEGATSLSRPVKIVVVGEPLQSNVVNIHTVDPEAAEQDPRLDRLSNTALLRVTRQGRTDLPLSVFYSVGGTAENGVDYAKLPGSVTIPQGAASADIVIEAIDDAVPERTESVVVTIERLACIAIYPPRPECYLVGPSPRAGAFVLDDDTPPGGAPPSATIDQPQTGALFSAPATIRIQATSVDPDAYAPMMEFFANDLKIGEAVITFIVAPPPGQPITFDFAWLNVPPGQYSVTAKATDDTGATGVSAPVLITVTESAGTSGSP